MLLITTDERLLCDDDDGGDFWPVILCRNKHIYMSGMF